MTDNDPNAEPVPSDASVVEVPPVAETRAPWAWAVLALLFLGMIFARVDDTSTRPTETFDDSELVLTLKQAMVAKYGISQVSTTKPDPSTEKQAHDNLVKIRNDTKGRATKDPAAAKLQLTAQYELGETPDPAALEFLSKSKDLADREYAQVYSSDKLDPGWVAGAKSRFPKHFLGRVVLAHALTKSGDPDASRHIVGTKDLLGLGLLLMAILGVLFVGFIIDVVGAVTLASGRFRPLGHPMTGLSKGDADRLALRMCGVVVLFVVIPVAMSVVFKSVADTDAMALVSEVLVFAAVVLFLRSELFGRADSYLRLVGRRDQWPKLCLYGVVGFAASLPVTLTMGIATTSLFKDLPKPSHPITDQIGAGAGPIAILMFFLLAVVMAPLLEEISFRGMLFPAIGRYIGPVGGILVSGFLFGAIHPQGPVLWAALASVGAFSALLAYLTGSLIPSMVMHACQNAMTLSVALVFLY